MANPVGTLYVSLDMDASAYKKAQKEIFADAGKKTDSINKIYKTVGMTSDKMYDAMRKNVTSALNAIKTSHQSSKAEIVRAEKGAAEKIKRINEQQYGRQVSLIEKMKKNWIGLSVAVYAAFRAIRAAWDLMDQAAMFNEQRIAFENLAKSYGSNGKKILAELRRVSEGTISTMAMVEKAGTAMMLGIAPVKLIKLMEIARATAKMSGQSVTKAFDDISMAVGRQSKMLLDNLGILVSVGKANKAYADENKILVTSMTDAERRTAFMNATIKAGDLLMYRLGNQTATTRDKMDQLKASIENARLAMGQGLTRAALMIYGSFQWLASGALSAAWGIYKLLEAYTRLRAKVGYSEKERTLLESAGITVQSKDQLIAQADSLAAIASSLQEGAVNLTGQAAENIAAAVASVNDFNTAMTGAVMDSPLAAGIPGATAAAKEEQSASEAAIKAVKKRMEAEKKAANAVLVLRKEIAKLQETTQKQVITEYDEIVAGWQKSVDERIAIEKEAEEKALKEREALYQHMMNNIQDIGANAVYNIIQNWDEGWAGAMDSMKELFLRTMAEIVSKQYIVPIIAPIVQSVMGGVAGGLSSAFGGVSGSSGISNLLGLGGGMSTFLNTSLGANPFGQFAGIDAALNAQMGALGATYGSVLGAAGLGSLGYSMLGGALGLPQGGYSGVGSAVGAGIGSIFGPLGTILGSAGGGFLGSMFGGGDKYGEFPGQTLTLGQGIGYHPKKGTGISSMAIQAYESTAADIQKMGALLESMGLDDFTMGMQMTIPGAKIAWKNAEAGTQKWIEQIYSAMWDQTYAAAIGAGWESGEALTVFLDWMEQAGTASALVIGSAFRDSIMTNDFTQFGLSVKDAVFNSVSEGLITALMQSEMMQRALQPLFYGVQNAINQALVGGEFDAELFNALAMPYLGQVNEVLASLQPAFDLISQSIMDTRAAVYEGTTPAGPVDMGTVAGYTAPTTPAVTNNMIVNTTILTDDHLAAMQEMMQKLGDFNYSFNLSGVL